MKKNYWFILIPSILGIGCWIAYTLQGSHLTEDGTLVEPFALIPIGRLCISIAIIAAIILLIKKIMKRKKD